MAMAFYSHKTLHSWPTTNLQAQKYESQKPQGPCNPHYNPVHESSSQDSQPRPESASSCYSVPETFPRSNLKIEAASQLRSFSSASGRILRPPLQLHQRPFLSLENIRPARHTANRTNQSDSDSDCSPEPPPVPPKDDCMTPPQCSLEPPPVPPKDGRRATPKQGHGLCVSGESDTEPHKHDTFGYLEHPSACTSYWSDPSCSESGSSTEDEEDEEEYTNIQENGVEAFGIEDSLLHFSVIQAQRLSFHTWILNPTTPDIAPNPRSKLNWRGQIGSRNIAGPHHSKQSKRWGIIF
ncbi:hypothetical protein FPCIR_7418 [Fusarium pseudocircinatum]|uniref:Uncharacterized protein n=1 Tax=Fusarium pseudocircinatum TaxID=56676 RepID=A0A8H5L7H8_9HYPO|nr:hypothetical protein FPCIR_7418 [Fusarium pseudocircinatum]